MAKAALDAITFMCFSDWNKPWWVQSRSRWLLIMETASRAPVFAKAWQKLLASSGGQLRQACSKNGTASSRGRQRSEERRVGKEWSRLVSTEEYKEII